jgi:hypothetical protein
MYLEEEKQSEKSQKKSQGQAGWGDRKLNQMPRINSGDSGAVQKSRDEKE